MAQQNVTFAIDTQSPIAVYVQIENLIQFAIASGRLKPGDTLPSVREMSLTLDINPNTVTKAYRDLEILQIVTTRRGVGVAISDKAPKICKEKTIDMVRGHLRDAIAECLAAGLSAADINAMVKTVATARVAPYSGNKHKS